MRSPVLLAAVLITSAQAAEVDPTSLYAVSTEGTTARLHPGQKGRFVLEIRSLKGAHVSDEAPLKLTLTGSGPVVPERTALSYGDSTRKKSEAMKYPDPRFEVPIAAGTPGSGAVEAKLTFFVCTADLCLRQQKTYSVPVTVD
jgi:hypothetical protein